MSGFENLFLLSFVDHEAEGILARRKGNSPLNPENCRLRDAYRYRVKVSANAGQLRLIVLVMRMPENCFL